MGEGWRLPDAVLGASTKVLYTLSGVTLAAGAPAGWLLSRAWSGGLASLAALAGEIRANLAPHLYLTLATSAAFALFGFVLGTLAARLGRAARRAALTGLANRQRVREVLERGVAAALRYARPLSVVMADVAVTLSCGVAGGVPDDIRWQDRVLEAADEALYEAKRSGRNAVRVRDAI